MIDQSLTATEEKALISLAFDEPEFFIYIVPQIKTEYFTLTECTFVYSIIKWHYERHGTLPSRQLTRDTVCKHLTVDDHNYQEVLDLFNYNIDPRDYAIIKKNVIQWLKTKAYGTLFNEEGINAYSTGDYEKLHTLIESASQIQDIGEDGMWFFDQTGMLFDETAEVKYTTGFNSLDPAINEGGPTKGDVICWMAPTGVGKCSCIDSKIIINKLSTIYILECEDGTITQLAGYREVKTTRGIIKVYNLTEDDDIIEIPIEQDTGDISL